MLIEALALAALSSSPAPPAGTSGELTWHNGALSNAVGTARKEGKMVLIYFWMDGSEYCKELWDQTLTTDAGQKVLGEFVLYSAKHGTPQGGALFEKFAVSTLPTMLFLTPEGAPEDLIGGMISAPDFAEEAARIQRGENTVSDLRKKADAHTEVNEAALQARFDLADRLAMMGQKGEAELLFASILADDPTGRTRLGARAWLEETYRKVAEAGGGDGKMAEWDVKPLVQHVEGIAHQDVRFEGWNRVANLEAARGDVAAACGAFGKAWKICPEDRVSGWAGEVSAFVIAADGERSKKEAKFALELAKASVEATENLTCEGKDDGCACDVCTHPETLVAYRMANLARAHRLNGDKRKAVKVAKQCIELDPGGKYEALLEELEAKG